MEGMGQKRRPLVVMASSSSAQAAARGGANLLAELGDRFRSLEAGVRAWMAKQPTHVEAAVTTAFGAIQGGALGGLMGTFAPDGGAGLPVPQPPPGLDPKAMATFKQAQALAGGPLVQARNFAVMTGGKRRHILCYEKDKRSGGCPGQVGQKFSQPKAQSEDIHYSRGRNMLKQLGLQNYEKNFKKGLLTDETLPLLNDSALRDVKIPPGPRLVILDHIKREHELTKSN